MLLGCTRVEINETTETGLIIESENTSPVAGEAVRTMRTSPGTVSVPSSCTPGWRCISSSVKAYQVENCSLTTRETCKLGCLNDSCKKPATCTAGFKCKGQYYKGYQLEDCSWTSTTKCEWGCENVQCLPQPNETSAASTSTTMGESTAVPARPSSPILKAGETVNVTVDGVGHPLRIYSLTQEYVQFELDGKKSERLKLGQSFTFFNGITITLVDIYLQSYAGGKQEVEYRVG